MNCLDFRRRIETAPNEVGGAIRAHAQTCSACQAFMHRVQAVDRKLTAAMRVPVPEHLQDRILLRQSFRARSPWRRMLPAMAAALLLAVALAGVGGRYFYDEQQLEREVVALVAAADYALASTDPVARERIVEALRPVGLSLSAPPGAVSFAGRCLVRGNLSGHLVLRDGGAPVTVFLMPDERLYRESRFEAGGWAGILVPAGRDGAFAIVAPPGKAVDGVRDRILSSVRWRAT